MNEPCICLHEHESFSKVSVYHFTHGKLCAYDDAMLEIKMSSKTLVYLEISTKCSIRFCAQRANAKKAERELNMQWHKPSNSCIFRIHKFHVWIMMISYNSYYWIRGRRKCRICTHFIIIQMERERGKLGIIISIETNKLCVLHAHTNTLNFSQNPPLCSWAHESDCNRIYLN